MHEENSRKQALSSALTVPSAKKRPLLYGVQMSTCPPIPVPTHWVQWRPGSLNPHLGPILAVYHPTKLRASVYSPVKWETIYLRCLRLPGDKIPRMPDQRVVVANSNLTVWLINSQDFWEQKKVWKSLDQWCQTCFSPLFKVRRALLFVSSALTPTWSQAALLLAALWHPEDVGGRGPPV